ncbi:MAG: hypothetical protein Q9M92_00670 [Enterobacterales bacterium]|nr:hypothetical protein [Enterobacterales bacterium]
MNKLDIGHFIKNKRIKQFLHSKKALPVIAIVGVLVLVIIIKSSPSMQHKKAKRASVAVSFINLVQTNIRPEIIGYGSVEADTKLQSKVEVTGRVTYVHPLLKKGGLLEKDTLLVKIDDKDYQLQLRQAEADLLANKANLKEMELNIENNELELELSKAKLKVKQKEYKRLKKLAKNGAVSRSSLDAESRNLLQQKQEVQQLLNKQTILPSTLEVMKAQLAIAESKLEKSQRDLARTSIVIPFTGRINRVYVEQDQFVQTGAPLFDASALDKMIVNAQFPMSQFSRFVSNYSGPEFQPEQISTKNSMSQILSSFGLSAMLSEAGGQFKQWQGQVERFSDDLDPKSRTVGVIVSVEGSYKNIKPGERPPLLEGMYMKVFIQGAKVNSFVFPKFAIHEGTIYLIDPQNKLKRVSVNSRDFQGDLVLIRPEDAKIVGLKAGDKIITSDLFPAVSGMDVTPLLDQDAEELLHQVTGTQP